MMKKLSINYHLEVGAGAGMSINPVAFLVVQENNVKLMPVDHASCVDRLLDYVPELMDKVHCMMNRCIENKKEETNKIIKQMQNKAKEKEKEVKRKEEKIEETMDKIKNVNKDNVEVYEDLQEFIEDEDE